MKRLAPQGRNVRLHYCLFTLTLDKKKKKKKKKKRVGQAQVGLLLLLLLYSFHPIAEITLKNANIKDEFKGASTRIN